MSVWTGVSLWVVVCSLPLNVPEPLAWRYSGRLSQGGRDADGQVVKRFSLFAHIQPVSGGGHQLCYSAEERGGGGFAWPERFGRIAWDKQGNLVTERGWRLLHEHNGIAHVIRLPGPFFKSPEPLREGGKWTEGRESFQVTDGMRRQDRDCWQVQVRNPLGPKRTIWVEKSTALIVEGEERVFVGQGEEHTLGWKLDSQQTVSQADQTRWESLETKLLSLQQSLQRDVDQHTSELTAVQLDKAKSMISELGDQAVGTPYAALVNAMRRDVQQQQKRGGELRQLATRMVGTAAPALKLRPLDQEQSQPIDYRGKITLLHFWDYKAEPLVEPYGQVGYLDHLYTRRQRLGVAVYGVALDSRAEQEATRRAADRSAAKLREFMNLSYPVTMASPEILREFGDPRSHGGQLPLWVVVGPDGKIVSYHTGYFQIQPNEGLKELDEILIPLIRQLRSSQDQKPAAP